MDDLNPDGYIKHDFVIFSTLCLIFFFVELSFNPFPHERYIVALPYKLELLKLLGKIWGKNKNMTIRKKNANKLL